MNNNFNLYYLIILPMNQPTMVQLDPATTTKTDGESIKTNEPIKKQRQYHFTPMVATILLYSFMAMGIAIQATTKISAQIIVPITFIPGYFVYLWMIIKRNKLAEYFENLRPLDGYQKMYNLARQNKGKIEMNTVCYHIQTTFVNHVQTDQYGNLKVWTSENNNIVYTHSASKSLYPSACVDISDNIKELPKSKQFIFFKYVPQFEFSDPNSQTYFQNSYKQFQRQNKKDQEQTSSYKFEIDGVFEKVVFSNSPKDKTLCIFYIWSVLGFGYYYLMYLECFKVSRFKVNVFKRITF